MANLNVLKMQKECMFQIHFIGNFTCNVFGNIALGLCNLSSMRFIQK